MERIITQLQAELDERSTGGGEESMSRILTPIREELGQLNQSLNDRPSTTATGSTEERAGSRDDNAPPPSYQGYC